jgi:Protein of unknown function (DUF3298)/Deacetylase PdaC
MKTIFFLSKIILICALFQNCQPNQTSTSSNEKAIDKLVKNDSESDHYFRLEGTIGEKPVTVHLVGNLAKKDAFSPVFRGFYAYDQFTEPISLYASWDSLRQNLIFEEAFEGNEPNKIIGKMGIDGSFSGVWSDALGKKVFPVKLKPSLQTGLVGFSSLHFKDSLLAQAKFPKGPTAFCEQVWLVPNAPTEAGLKTFLEKEIRMGMVGDSLGGLVETPKAAFLNAKKSLFDDFSAFAKEWDSADSTQSVSMYMQDESSKMDVFYADNKLLTLGFMQYSYTGGAHGNYGTTVRSYNLETKKRLELADILKPNYQKKLASALTKSAKRKFGLRPTDNLEGVLFVKIVEPNNNFGLTPKGIFFSYVPYEIASYAQGELQIFVPFAEIRDLIKQDYGY